LGIDFFTKMSVYAYSSVSIHKIMIWVKLRQGSPFLGWIMTLNPPVRTVASLTEPGTKKGAEPYGKANTGL